MFRIAKRFTFSAAHQLLTLPKTHKCHRLHGHNYTVEIVLESQILNEHGFIVDYADLGQFKEYIDSTLDHKFLNEVLEDTSAKATSAEWLAYFLYYKARSRFGRVVRAVRVSETENTWAEYFQ